MAKDKGKKVKDEEELELDEDEEEDDEPEADDDADEADESDEDEKPKKSKKKGKPGKGNLENLVPREPVSVPKAIFKAQSPEIQKLLKDREKAQAEGDKKGLRKIRSALRRAGFRLSKIGEDDE